MDIAKRSTVKPWLFDAVFTVTVARFLFQLANPRIMRQLRIATRIPGNTNPTVEVITAAPIDAILGRAKSHQFHAAAKDHGYHNDLDAFFGHPRCFLHGVLHRQESINREDEDEVAGTVPGDATDVLNAITTD